MPRSLERFNSKQIRVNSPHEAIRRALAEGKAAFKAQHGRDPKTFFLTPTAYADLESKFPGNHRGVQRIFYGMSMQQSSSMGLTNDQFEITD